LSTQNAVTFIQGIGNAGSKHNPPPGKQAKNNLGQI
jgi:hypothetical protein